MSCAKCDGWKPCKWCEVVVLIKPGPRGFVLTDASGRRKLTAAEYHTERSAKAARAAYLKWEKEQRGKDQRAA